MTKPPMIAAATENPCQRWYTELELVVAPLVTPKLGTVQPESARAAMGSAAARRARRQPRVRVDAPCGGRAGDSTSRPYSLFTVLPVGEVGKVLIPTGIGGITRRPNTPLGVEGSRRRDAD